MLLMYVGLSFVELNFNAFQWSENTRKLFVVIDFVIILSIYINEVIISDINKNKTQ